MRLDPNSLNVQSFATSVPQEPVIPGNTGKGGPDSYCWICYETGNTVPTCGGAAECQPTYTQLPPCVDTWLHPFCNITVAEA
jgi:hypothetical protein